MSTIEIILLVLVGGLTGNAIWASLAIDRLRADIDRLRKGDQ